METRVSIAMAVYNGEQYINEQIDSILIQLKENDELIISYDTSIDETWRIINEYASNDNIIKVFKNPNKGVVSNFQNALSHCMGQYIFYADQDDVWMKEKIETVLVAFQDPKVTVVIHDSCLTDKDLNITHVSTFSLRHGNTSLMRNFVRLSYIGCCLAFRAELKDIIIPIPNMSRSHDWWTGTMCTIFGKMALIDKPLICHRQHEGNATPKKRLPMHKQIEIRWIIATNALKRCITHRKILVQRLKGKKW